MIKKYNPSIVAHGLNIVHKIIKGSLDVHYKNFQIILAEDLGIPEHDLALYNYPCNPTSNPIITFQVIYCGGFTRKFIHETIQKTIQKNFTYLHNIEIRYC
jgi:hypothetical protein